MGGGVLSAPAGVSKDKRPGASRVDGFKYGNGAARKTPALVEF